MAFTPTDWSITRGTSKLPSSTWIATSAATVQITLSGAVASVITMAGAAPRIGPITGTASKMPIRTPSTRA